MTDSAVAATPNPDTSFRCWICLEDEQSLEHMISPCACVGTNQWVHMECVKMYCLQHLANHEPVGQRLQVKCPICKTDYRIAETSTSDDLDGFRASWREYVQWSTDRHLIIRHARFLLLIGPLAASALVTWSSLLAYWAVAFTEGPGEMLMESDTVQTVASTNAAGALRYYLLDPLLLFAVNATEHDAWRMDSEPSHAESKSPGYRVIMRCIRPRCLCRGVPWAS